MGSAQASPDPAERIEAYASDVRELLATWKFTRRQLAALWHIAQFLLYGGAKGGGKTVFLCRWAVIQCAMYPGNKGFLGRKRSVDFKNTTLETFKRYIDPRLYRVSKQEQRIYLPWCNGQIDFGGMDDPDLVQKFNSAEYGFVGVDQAEEIDQDQLAMLVGTLRHVLPNGEFPSYHVRLTANPAECFLKYEYIENPRQGDPVTGKGTRAFIKALHTDNPFLPPDYVPNMRDAFRHRPKLLKAYLEGIWDDLSAIDILIQPSWVEICKAARFTGNITKRILTTDVARQGDDENVTYGLEKSDTKHIRIFHENIQGYTDNLIDMALRLVALRRKTNSMLNVVDAVGLGAGVFDAIRRIKDDDGNPEPVIGFIGGSTDAVPEHLRKKYTNLKSMVWHQGAEEIHSGLVCLPNDPVLCGQLLWQKTVIVNEQQSRVLTKKELKEKRKQSPDRGESFMNGLYALRVSKPLPDNQPITRGKEFWKNVKRDISKIEAGDKESADYEEI